jgi:CheY-like chemotaxis protein
MTGDNMVLAEKFQDKSARVVLVEPNASVRQLFSEVFKTLGFAQAQSVASLADAHHIIETESVDWLVVPLNADQDITGLL